MLPILNQLFIKNLTKSKNPIITVTVAGKPRVIGSIGIYWRVYL
jgi:hypothetical protein